MLCNMPRVYPYMGREVPLKGIGRYRKLGKRLIPVLLQPELHMYYVGKEERGTGVGVSG